MIRRTQKLWRLLQRKFCLRRLPHGLLSIRYLWPGDDGRVRVHRTLWWANGDAWPRPIWLLMEAWLWLAWVGFWAWVACWRLNRYRQRTGNNLAGDWQPASDLRLLWLALAWCIPPRDSICFGLHRNPDAAMDYVYDHELAAWHRRRSLSLGLSVSSLQLLQDKPRLCEFLCELGLPMAPILAVVPWDAPAVDLASYLSEHDEVFCKMRSGNQGRGAFAAWRQEQGIAGQTHTGQPLPDTRAVENAWRELLALDDALIQPRLKNHPALSPLGLPDEAITVRYISEWGVGGLFCLSAMLEVPTHRTKIHGDTLYTFLPIQPGAGQLLPWPAYARQPVAGRAWTERLYRVVRESGLNYLPRWSELVGYSHQAHAAFPDIYAIAWDWVITPSGPLLLEGNVGWGAAMPQRILGGFLHSGRI